MKEGFRKLLAHKRGIFVLALAPAILLYLSSLNYEWTSLDEQWMIVHNTGLQSGRDQLRKAFTESLASKYYRPVLQLSFVLDHKLGKIQPRMYHISNLIFHLLSICLLLKFLLRINVRRTLALGLSIIFGIHPLLIHAVAWIPGRNDSLLCVFSLAALLSLIEFLQALSSKKYFFHLLFFVLALLTKENAIMLPFVFFILSFNLFQNKHSQRFLLPAAWILLTALFVYLHHKILPQTTVTFDLNGDFLKKFLCGFFIYTGKVLYPFQNSVMPGLENSSILAGIFVFLLIVIVSFKPGLHNKQLALTGLILFITLLVLPVFFSSIGSANEHFEHRAYLPLAGMIIFVSQIKFSVNTTWLRSTFVILLLVFFAMSFKRSGYYKNENSFLDAGIAEGSQFYLFYQRKAELMINEGKLDSALVLLNRAIEKRPDIAKMYNTRGNLYMQMNKPDQAANDYTKAIELSEYDDYYYLNRFLCYYKQGDLVQSMKDLYYLKTKCASILPPKETQEVIDQWSRQFEKLLAEAEKNPNAELYSFISSRYSDIGLHAEALASAEKACRLDSSTRYLLILEQCKQRLKQKKSH